MQPLLGFSAEPALYAGVGAAALAIAAGLWFALAPGPRRSRAYKRAQRLLHQGDWQSALEIARRVQSGGRLSKSWQGRLTNLEGECHRAAGDAALQAQCYEDSLKYYLQAAPLLGLDSAGFRIRVLESLLAEVRRLFAEWADTRNSSAIQELVARALLLQSPYPEASFWQGLCQVRDGRLDLALVSLTTAHEGGDKRFLDPPLYLGALLLREGRAQEALRYLSEANRIDGNCPFVTWQLGMALDAAGGDANMAVRALQRALGPRGLGLWSAWSATVLRPESRIPMGGSGPPSQRAWVEAFPEGKSFVRRLAAKHAFVCPVFGSDLTAMIRQGRFALAQAQYRAGNYQDSADLFTQLLQDSPPTTPLLRGLGLALTRLERYDEAFKHLRTALEQEEPKSHVTAGYLALCGTLGKPTQPEDRPKNVAWAIRLLARFDVLGDAEWARLGSRIFAEARQLGMPVAAEDQLRLCDVLASVHAADAEAAAAYDQLAATDPEAVRPEHAWLYCRAAQQLGFAGQRDLELFGRTFREPVPARDFYQAQQWDFDEAEYVYLERWAGQRPGRFPEALGPEYAARGESFLLARSRQREEAGQKDAALASADVLHQLAPRCVSALDRLAHLHYQNGDLDRAATLLTGWHALEPGNPWPLVRRAVVEQQRGNGDSQATAINQALELTHGPLRAAIAFLGACLQIAKGTPEHLQPAIRLLQECLKDDPQHTEALWHLAAVRSVLGDLDGLTAQAAAMNRADVTDPRFHYLAAVCHLAARDYPQVLQAASRVVELCSAAAKEKPSPALGELIIESHYLKGWAHLLLQDPAAATVALQKVAGIKSSPSAEYARALLGRIRFAEGAYEDAIQWWTALAPPKRGDWHFDEALRATVFASGLLAFGDGKFEQAAGRFREAGRLGLRDRRVEPLMVLALVKAGQHLLYREGGDQGAAPLEVEPVTDGYLVLDDSGT